MVDEARIEALKATIATLRASIYSGVLRARINNRDTTFRSLTEMKEALRMAEAELASLSPQPARRRTRQLRFITGTGL